MHAIQRNAGSSAEQVFTLDREKLEWLSPDGMSASHRPVPPLGDPAIGVPNVKCASCSQNYGALLRHLPRHIIETERIINVGGFRGGSASSWISTTRLYCCVVAMTLDAGLR
jgi:hypothetical protein